MAYGIFEAREIVRQGEVFLGAAADPTNAATRAKLVAEGLTADVEQTGQRRLGDAR